MCEYKPNLYHDVKIYSNDTFLKRDKLYMIGSEERDRTIKIPKNMCPYLETVLPYINGNYTVQEINDILEQKNLKMNISVLINKLRDNGLLEDSLGIEKSELRIVSSKLFVFNFTQPRKWIIKLCRFIVKCYPYVIGTLFLLCLYAMFIQQKNILDYFDLRKSGLIVIVFNTLFVTLHEFGHLIYAIANDIQVENLEIRLQWGFVPIVFIKYKGLYFIPVNKRMNLTLSGIYMHLFWMLLGLFIAFETNSVWAQGIFINNLLGIVINTEPYNITDGYYALCILFNRYDIRISILKKIARFRVKRLRDLPLVTFYIAIPISSLYLTILWSYETSFSIQKIININQRYIFVVILTVILVQFFLSLRQIKNTFQKLKSI